MDIRTYRKSDLDEVVHLFYETVHRVNCKDYSESQLDAWAPLNADRARWSKKLETTFSVIAESNGELVGFGNLEDNGCFDCLFVSYKFQGRGAATKIAEIIEGKAAELGIETVFTEASITARQFFEKRGYIVFEEQHKPYNGEVFINYKMRKLLRKV